MGILVHANPRELILGKNRSGYICVTESLASHRNPQWNTHQYQKDEDIELRKGEPSLHLWRPALTALSSSVVCSSIFEACSFGDSPRFYH